MLVAILFPFILVLDSFMTSIAYGTNKIKIPKYSIIILSFISTLFLAISLIFASKISSFLPSLFSNIVSAILLFLLGISNLLHFLFSKGKKKEKKLSLKFKQTHIVVAIYFDELKADIDSSNTLSSKEALLLGIALSFDSILSGFSIGLSNTNIPLLLSFSFSLNIFFLTFGLWIGNKISNFKYDFSWISAFIFFLLSLSKLFF